GPWAGGGPWGSTAYGAAAAPTPAWRIPPPNSLRTRRARATKSRVPHRAEPIGAPRPLLKQTDTLSKFAAHSAAGMPVATTAFHRRAPAGGSPRPFLPAPPPLPRRVP